MDLSDLLIFSTVVREGGVTRAAERLHRVQSNVTTRSSSVKANGFTWPLPVKYC
jgi:DNA-binding transcriptional LysR family regulator